MKKLLFWVEIAALYLLLCGFNILFFPEAPAFFGIEPHPYWIGILIFGFRYGVTAGVAAGLLSSLLYMGAVWFYLERYLFEEIAFYIQPALFLLVGTFMGAGVHRYRSDLADLREEKQTWLHNEKLLKDEAQTLKEINAGLEKRIVTRMSTLITLYEGARRLEEVDIEELYRSLLEFTAKTLQAEEAAIYLKTEEGWVLKENFGWKPYQRYSKRLKNNEGLVGAAGSSNKIVTIRDFVAGQSQTGGPLPSLLGDSLMAGPLRMGETGEVVGVVGIQSIPFFQFNSASVNLFSFLLNWASRSLGRAHFIAELRSEEVLDPEFQVYSYRYFQSRLAQEFSRSKTYYLPLSVGLVEAKGLKNLKRPQRGALLTALSQLLKESVREMDVVARFPEEEKPFALLLMTVSSAQAEGVRQKIEHLFSQMIGKEGKTPVQFHVGLASFSPKVTDPESLIHEAKHQLEAAH